jgi:dihydroorotate dehydrogenase (fumarate)
MNVDLTTTYLGLELAHPVLPSASPLTGDIDHIHALVEAGAPAVVLPSLFEEQIEHDEMAVHYSLELGADGFGEAPEGFFP